MSSEIIMEAASRSGVVSAVGGVGGSPTPHDVLEPAPGLLYVPYPAVLGLWEPRFPTPDLVSAATGLLERPAPVRHGLRSDGAVPRQEYVLEVAAGVLAISRSLHGGDDSGKTFRMGQERGDVLSWSRKSRALLRRRLAELDYVPLLRQCGGLSPVMLTLTYPGKWESVAPSAVVSKSHFDALRKRWARKFGSAPVWVWKLEFQRRGAPHYHVLSAVPQFDAAGRVISRKDFREWLSVSWADVVGATGEEYARHVRAGTGVDEIAGETMIDPRRLAQYFLKHGDGASKEYQHIVPDLWLEAGGAGRFWGIQGMKRVSETVPLTRADYLYLRRVFRRYWKSIGLGSNLGGTRHHHESGAWLLFNDAPATLSRLVPHLPSNAGAWS